MVFAGLIVAATPDLNGSVIALLAVALLSLGAAGIAAWISRAARQRRRNSEVREIVRVVEEIRSGRRPQPAQVESGSALAIVADAVHRLAQESGARSRDVEAAQARMHWLSETIEDTAVITTDIDGDVASFSRGATALFGWPEDEIAGRSAAALFEETAFKEFLPKLARRASREQGISLRSTMVRRDTTTFDGDLTVRQLHGSRSGAEGFVLIVRDATPSVELERRLQASEERSRTLVEAWTDGMAIVSDGRFQFVNSALAKLLGEPSESLVGVPVRERVASGDLLLIEEQLASVATGKVGEERLMTRLVDASGSVVAEVGVDLRPFEHEGRTAVLLLIRDETVTRRVASELRINEARLDAALEASVDGLLILSGPRGSGHVRVTNWVFARMFGLEVEALLGLDENALSAMLHARSKAAAGVAQLIGRSGELARRGTIRVGGSKPREYEISISPLRDRNGEVLGQILVCRDVSDRRQAEGDLRALAERVRKDRVELEKAHAGLQKSHDEAMNTVADAEAMNAELRTINGMKSDLLGNVAHELQTPLVAIRGYTEMIHKGRLGPISEEQRRGLATALHNIDRLIAMIDGLLTFARQESEIGELSLSNFELRPLVSEVVVLLKDQFDAAGVELRVDIEPGLVVHADRENIFQVFVNLLSNAAKFNRRGGSAVVSARSGPDDRANVRVEDTGVGITKENLERIFDRHFRAVEDERGAVPGSGIGLAIVRDILRLHGCRVHVESEFGTGTVFSFGLPVTRGKPDTPTPEESGPTNGSPPRLRILPQPEDEGSSD